MQSEFKTDTARRDARRARHSPLMRHGAAARCVQTGMELGALQDAYWVLLQDGREVQ
jgi:hypothetical protein